MSLASGRTVWTLTSARRAMWATSGNLAAQGIDSALDRGLAAAVTYVTSGGPILQGGVLRQQAQGIALTQFTLRAIFSFSS